MKALFCEIAINTYLSAQSVKTPEEVNKLSRPIKPYVSFGIIITTPDRSLFPSLFFTDN